MYVTQERTSAALHFYHYTVYMISVMTNFLVLISLLKDYYFQLYI
jgi:hypothetical protein